MIDMTSSEIWSGLIVVPGPPVTKTRGAYVIATARHHRRGHRPPLHWRAAPGGLLVTIVGRRDVDLAARIRSAGRSFGGISVETRLPALEALAKLAESGSDGWLQPRAAAHAWVHAWGQARRYKTGIAAMWWAARLAIR
jgi:hypothetical protein